MHTKHHILLGVAFALILLLFSEPGLFELGVFLALTVFIDLDHVIAFLTTGRRWSEFKTDMMIHFKEKRQRLYLLHKIEFPLLLLFASSFDRIFYFAFLGAFYHLLLDIYVYNIHHRKLYMLKTFSYTHDLYCWFRRVPAY
jgi:hypothetical protein